MGFKFPHRFGATDRTREIEHEALLDALAPGWDVSEGTEVYAETSSEALAVSMIWAINTRVSRQRNPLRMLEDLTTWETACNTRPTSTDTDNARRKTLAAKLRGLAGNALVDLEAASQSVLGDAFDALVTVDPDDWITYWPGLNPGPPGYEWSSNRAIIGIRMLKDRLSESEMRRLRSKLILVMNSIKPAWQTFSIGVGSQWVVNIAIVGQTVI